VVTAAFNTGVLYFNVGVTDVTSTMVAVAEFVTTLGSAAPPELVNVAVMTTEFPATVFVAVQYVAFVEPLASVTTPGAGVPLV